jgi:hypothetical protein
MAAPLAIFLAAAAATPVIAQEGQAAPAAASPAAIGVSVDGQPVPFAGQGPVMHASGSVLVPLRGVFEKLGAGVQYAPQTKTITAIKGETTVSLRLGDPTAYVNNVPRPLTVAPQLVNGATLVPLRFVSEALGAQVKWDAATQTVLIAAAQAADNTPITGTVTAVDAAERSVTIRPAGANKDVKVALIPDAALLTKAGDAPAVAAADLLAVRVGDLVTIKRNDQGQGFSLQAEYEERRGEIKSVDAAPAEGNPKVTFADDSVAEIAPGITTVTQGTEIVALSDVKPGQKLLLRVNPQTRLASAVVVEIPNVEIASVTHSAAGDRLLKAGDEVTVSVVGTPGAKGVFSVSGIAAITEQPLTETAGAPGTYSATFKVPEGAAVQNGAITALLHYGGVTSQPAQSPANLNIDATGPAFADLAPGQGSNSTNLRPRFSGTYADQGSGVDPAGTRLLVNGKDVTAQAKVEKGFFLYEPAADLPAGENTVALVARDMAGNEARQEWTFAITPIVSPLKVVTLLDVPENRPLAAGEVLKVRAEAAPGGSARFSIGKNGAITGTMFEQGAGVYMGQYTVKKGDSLTREPVTVTFTPADGKEATLAAVQTVSLSAGAPRPPVIDLPVEGSAVGGYVTISGRGTPNTKVRLKLSYNGKQFLFRTSAGGSLASVEIPVGADGAWKSEVVSLSTARDISGVTFTAEAVTVASDGDVSDTAVVRFKR